MALAPAAVLNDQFMCPLGGTRGSPDQQGQTSDIWAFEPPDIDA
jgi:hypothetical protein